MTDQEYHQKWIEARRVLRQMQANAKCKKYAAPALTVEQMMIWLESRGQLCPICQCRTACNLDHDHRTGKVRGWLCSQCNTGLGHFAETPARFDRAKEWINAID